MTFNTFLRHLRVGFNSIFRNGWMTVASVTSIVVSLFVLGVFIILVLNVNALADKADKQVQIRAYLNLNVDQKLREKVQNAVHAHGDADIRYVLHRDYWGRGRAAEAAGLLLQLGFGQLGLSRIWATCDVENRASARVLEKIGMQREGRLRRNLLIRGRWRDSYLYAILADDWRRAREGRSP